MLASALCGFATSTSFLIVAQLLQGVGAAFFLPSSLTLLTQSFPDPSCALALREVPFRRSPTLVSVDLSDDRPPARAISDLDRTVIIRRRGQQYAGFGKHHRHEEVDLRGLMTRAFQSSRADHRRPSDPANPTQKGWGRIVNITTLSGTIRPLIGKAAIASDCLMSSSPMRCADEIIPRDEVTDVA